MSVTSTLKKQVDMPVWEYCRFAPIVSAAGMTLCSDPSDGGRYMYYMGATCYRYDTWSDGWQLIATPNYALTTVGTSTYQVANGYRGKVISATSTTLTMAGLQGQKLLNKKIRIVSGKGMGQERTISAVDETLIWDHGVATAASTSVITDNQTIPKKWKINQWTGYQVRLVYGVGQSQVRKILYNDFNSLTVTDPNWQPYDSWNNTGFAATAPYALPVVNTQYFIESTNVTISSPWTTIPDNTSRYMVLSGGVWFLTGKTLAAGSAAMQYYDVISDTWITKTTPGGFWPVLAQTDIALEHTGEKAGTFDTGLITFVDPSTTLANRMIIDTSKNWTTERYSNYEIRLKDVSFGTIQRRRILGNDGSTMHIERGWTTNPSLNDTYEIYGDTNAIWVTGNAQSSVYKYLIEEDLWTAGQNYDSGVTSNIAFAKAGNMGFHVTNCSVNNAGVITINPTPTAPGNGYRVGDVLLVTGGTAKVRVLAINPSTGYGFGGPVAALELFSNGPAGTYTAGTGKATSYFFPAAGGGGTGCTIEITSVGLTAWATTTVLHDFKVGDVVYGYGCTDASWNQPFTITTCDSTNIFQFIPNTSAGAIGFTLNSSTVIVDPTKNWIVNEHQGKAVTLTNVFAAATAPLIQIRKIASNTATALTVATIGANTLGTGKYIISDLNFFGRDDQVKINGQGSNSRATGGNATQILDSTKSWQPGQWMGYKVKVLCGTGFDKGEIVIATNDSSSLTLTTPGFTPDRSTKYRIMDSYGTAVNTLAATTLADTTKNWAVNQWVGKNLRLSIPTLTPAIETLITANTSTGLTFVTTTTACDANTVYTILGDASKNSGTNVMWNWGSSRTADRGKYLFVPRGGTAVAVGLNAIDRYDITQDEWDNTIFTNPNTEIETLGCQWAYDGKDRIYWTPSGAQATRVFAMNINSFEIEPAGIHPYANGAAVQGNRMEIIRTADGLKYLFTMRVTGAEFFKTLLWWND